MKRPWGLVALGEALVEFAELPADEGEGGLKTYRQGFGGDTSNLVIAAARAGGTAAYLSRVGTDDFGLALTELWQREGVDHQAVELDSQAATGLYFVHRRPQGHEFSYRRAGSAASLMTPAYLHQPLVRERIAGAEYLHLSGISAAISPSARATVFAAVELARAAGTKVSFDVNLRLKLWSLAEARAVIPQLVAKSDIFLPSLEDMESLIELSDPDQIIDWSHQQGARLVVLKCGADGAVVSLGTERFRVPARTVTVLDSTGAGDCFCGTLLARLSLGDELRTAVVHAIHAAADCVQRLGAV